MSDEIEQLTGWFQGDDPAIRQIIRTVCLSRNAISPRELFAVDPDLAFELHEQIADMVDETSYVGDFERNLEREVM